MNAPREVMRLVRRRGGRIEKAETHFDHDRNGRVMVLEVFWPDQSGYDDVDGAA